MQEQAEDTHECSYRGALLLAPMVRINHLPFRMLAAEHGASMVYSEELVDRSILACRRSENQKLNTIDFHHGDGKLIFRVKPHERVVLQLGTASACDALRAAHVACSDVRAIDINMGCPVKFSTQGGMGSALLTQPEKVRDILRTLVRNLEPLPVTCKIRLLDSPQETLQLARLISGCGVAALAVHARRRHDRPRHWAQWDQLPLLRQAIGDLPLILNGDVFLPEDISRAYEETAADSLMLARGAMWNASIFRGASTTLKPQSEVVQRYVELCEQTDNPFGNSKYVVLQMLDGGGKTAAYKMLQQAKDYTALRAAAAATASEPHFQVPSLPPLVLEPPPDMPHVAALPVNRWRVIPPHCKAAREARRRSCIAAEFQLPTASLEAHRGEFLQTEDVCSDPQPVSLAPLKDGPRELRIAPEPLSGVKRQAPCTPDDNKGQERFEVHDDALTIQTKIRGE